MPIDPILVSAAVVAMFLVFAGVLAWGEVQTRPMRLPAAARAQNRHGNQNTSGNYIALRS